VIAEAIRPVVDDAPVILRQRNSAAKGFSGPFSILAVPKVIDYNTPFSLIQTFQT
jgi:hypothetical protein